MSIYQEPVKIEVTAAPSFSLAALNKCLIITDEGVAENATVGTFVFSSSTEVSEKFGNNSKIFKGVEYFLGQLKYPAQQALTPEYFTVLSVEATATGTEIVQALKDADDQVFYGFSDVLEDGTLTELETISYCNEYMKYRFYDKGIVATIDDANRSNRQRAMHNKVPTEYKALADMALNITGGAGSKSDMNITTMCSTDVSGGERATLTTENINFTEKKTSKNYVVIRTGVASDGTYTDETTAIDAIVYNCMDNLELFMAEKGFKQDSTGYNDLENLLNKVMGEMGQLGLIAQLDSGQYDFKVQEVSQTATEKQLKVLRPVVEFVLADWATRVELTLARSYDTVVGSDV